MTTTARTLELLSREFQQGVLWLSRRSREAWDALANSASGQSSGSSGALSTEAGPAVVLMAGGLTTLAALMTFFLARSSVSSKPDPVNTRGSRQKARESVDVYVDGGQTKRSDEQNPEVAAAGAGEQANPAEQKRSTAPEGMIEITSNGTEWRTTSPASAGPSDEDDEIETLGPEDIEPIEEDDLPWIGGGSDVQRSFQRGQTAGAKAPVSSTSDVFDCIVASNLGQPSLVRSTPNLYEIRLSDCRGCRSSEGGQAPDAQAGCPFEAGFLEGAMSRFIPGGVVVRETECRSWGDEACAFEVWY